MWVESCGAVTVDNEDEIERRRQQHVPLLVMGTERRSLLDAGVFFREADSHDQGRRPAAYPH